MSCPLKRFPVKAKTIGSEESNPEKVKEINDLYTKMMAERNTFDKENNAYVTEAVASNVKIHTTTAQATNTESDAFAKMLAERKRQDEQLNKFLTEDEYNALNGKGPASNS